VSRSLLLRLALWILAGAALRFAILGADGLWLDEGYTAWTVDLPAARHKVAMANDDAPPLYYGVQRMIVPHLPKNEVSLRFLSGAASVAGLACLAAFPPSTLAIEAPVAFLAIAPYGVAYGRQARSYALLILFEIVLIIGTARVLQGKRRWLIAVALAEGLALWTHNIAATLVLGANLAWLLCGRRDPRGWLAAQSAALLIWLPYVPRLLTQLRVHDVGNLWIVEFWKHAPLALAAVFSLGYMSAGVRVWPPPPTRHWWYAGAGSHALSILTLATVAILLVSAFGRKSRKDAILASSFTLGPLVALEAISFVTVPSYVLGRTDSVAYVGFALWCALGLRNLPRPARWASGGILAISAILALSANMPVGGRAHHNDRDIGRRIHDQIRPGDWVTFVGLSRPSIGYYAFGGKPGRPDSGIRDLDYPASFGRNPSATFATPAESLRVWEQEAYRVREQFEAGAAPESRMIYIGPTMPNAPGEMTAEDLAYPGAMLGYILNGKRPLEKIGRVRGDGVGVDWIAFSVARDRLIPLDELQPIEGAP
jgi:hypothetical protein